MWNPVPIQSPLSTDPDILKLDKDDPLILESREVPKPLICKSGINILFHDLKNILETKSYRKSLKRMYAYKHTVNAFEHHISNVDFQDIETVTTRTLQFPFPIDNRAGYKYLEMNNLYNFIPDVKKAIHTLHLCEAPGSFIQVTSFLRDKKYNDTFHSITLHGAIEYNSKLMQHLVNEKPRRYYPFETAKDPTVKMSTGDITKSHTINFLMDKLKTTRPLLITADGGHDVRYENYQEQESSMLVLGEAVAAVSVCAKNGSFVLKLFDMSTKVTHKMLTHILGSFFTEVHLVKPLMSRASNAERYVVCKGFKYDGSEKEYLKKLTIVLSMFQEADQLNMRGMYIGDIFPTIQAIDDDSTILDFNSKVASLNYETIHNKIEFIQTLSPEGLLGQTYRDRQKKAVDIWKATNL